ncbi:MAG: hypothetical protein AAF289_05450 [Cyanobacteria bacterium P01_A01_bin.135]
MNTSSISHLSRRSAIQWTSWLAVAAAAVIVADYEPPIPQQPPTDYPPTTAMVEPLVGPIDLMLS